MPPTPERPPIGLEGAQHHCGRWRGRPAGAVLPQHCEHFGVGAGSRGIVYCFTIARSAPRNRPAHWDELIAETERAVDEGRI
jgi:hypothetical protein